MIHLNRRLHATLARRRERAQPGHSSFCVLFRAVGLGQKSETVAYLLRITAPDVEMNWVRSVCYGSHRIRTCKSRYRNRAKLEAHLRASSATFIVC